MRVGVGSEVFEISGRNADVGRTERSILHGRIGDRTRQTFGLQISAALPGDDDGMLLRGDVALIGIIGRAQPAALGTNIAEFQKPIAPYFLLDREVPLLRSSDNPVQRNRELDQSIHVAAEGPAAGRANAGESVSQR